MEYSLRAVTRPSYCGLRCKTLNTEGNFDPATPSTISDSKAQFARNKIIPIK